MIAPPRLRLLCALARARAAVVALVLLTVPAAAVAQRDAATGRDPLRIHQQKHREYRDEFEKSLLRAAEHCDAHALSDEAARIRAMAAPVDLDALKFDPLPKEVQPEIRLDLPETERTWKLMVHRAREEYAKDLYLLSRRLVNGGHPSYALQVVREAASHDPDNRAVRSILGFVRYGDEWVTPYTQSMLEKKFVWHASFGWLPKNHVANYEAGQRFFKNRWMPARQEAELRRDFANAWEVRTDHFLVKTNHSLERGVEVATALEDFHGFFMQAFAAFFQSPEQLRKLFESANGRRPSASAVPPHKVNYYATREEYVDQLLPKIPQIAITNGLYFTDDRTAYFFHNAAGDGDTTLYHEATHQFLYESSPRGRAIAEKEQFWVIEGIACYMESFKRENGQVSVGDPRYVRFEAARYRRLVDHYYVPFAEFEAMGRNEFQNSPNISKNYSQASGLAHFFMHYDGGRYRDALIEHLSQHYSVNRRTPGSGVQSLSELTGATNEQLDREYGEFQESLEKPSRNNARVPSESR